MFKWFVVPPLGGSVRRHGIGLWLALPPKGGTTNSPLSLFHGVAMRLEGPKDDLAQLPGGFLDRQVPCAREFVASGVRPDAAPQGNRFFDRPEGARAVDQIHRQAQAAEPCDAFKLAQKLQVMVSHIVSDRDKRLGQVRVRRAMLAER